MVEALVQQIVTDMRPSTQNVWENLSSTVGMASRRYYPTTKSPRNLSIRELLACLTASMLIYYAASESTAFKKITEARIELPQAVSQWFEDTTNRLNQYCSRYYHNQF